MLSTLTFHVAFNKTVRASKASWASEAVEVSQPVQAKRAGEPVQADRTVNVINLSRSY